MKAKLLLGAPLLLTLAAPLAAKDSLGVFGLWGAFRDPAVPRCYAIAEPSGENRAGTYTPYASVGTWPRRQIRGQLHVRMSRKVSPAGTITLRIGGRSFELIGGGGDAWPPDRRTDAAVVAAMRSAARMSVTARDTAGRSFTDSYSLEGVATAMDAATVACARIR